MSESKLRRTTGRLKYKVLDCWPYKFKEKKASKLRIQLRTMVSKLPQLPPVANQQVEVHMFCGKAQLDMGIWASWSVLRFLQNAVLYVHSDGTMNQEDVVEWRSIIPDLVFVSKEAADNRVSTEIAPKFPALYTWRCNYWSGSQVVDVHLFGKSDRLIIMDSDVLCFRDPIELRKALSSGEFVCRWNKDVRSCYSADIELLNQVTGLFLPEAFNCGFSLITRLREKEFIHLEKMLGLIKTDGRIDLEHYWSGQTYYAMCAAIFPESHALSNGYDVTLGCTSDDTVVRHYVGIPRVRPRYFTEGIPRLLYQLKIKPRSILGLNQRHAKAKLPPSRSFYRQSENQP